MSTKSSFREQFERLGAAKARSRVRSTSPTARLVLTRRKQISRPIDVTRLLASHGLTLRKAHDVLGRISAGEQVAIELHALDIDKLIADLSRLGVLARTIQTPNPDVRYVRGRLGVSQEEFAIRFGLEVDTIRNWEQRRNEPDSATRLLLTLIQHHPQIVQAILVGDDPQSAPSGTLTPLMRYPASRPFIIETKPDPNRRVSTIFGSSGNFSASVTESSHAWFLRPSGFPTAGTVKRIDRSAAE